MYKWYRQSRICYAYLEDVTSATAVFGTGASRSFDPNGVFERSRWFTRGWTLQELIAPDVVEIFAGDWTEVGTKASLAVELAHITGIDERVLNGADVSLCNVAERLSWAASRQTAKLEDTAYCLLGIFGVNMPLIYGEGINAFHRLQEAILREIEDYTILTWGMTVPVTPALLHDREISELSLPEAVEAVRSSEGSRTPGSTPLAVRPGDFKVTQPRLWRYSSLEQHISGPDIKNDTDSLGYSPPTVTSRGIQLWVRVLDCTPTSCLAYINCRIFGRVICIALRQISTRGVDVYSRLPLDEGGYLFLAPDCLPSFRLRRIYLEREDDRADTGSALAPLLESWKPVELSVHGDEMQCFGGWNASLDGDLSRVHLLDFAVDNPQAVRCLYKDQKALLIIVYPDSCEIISCTDSRVLLPHDGLLKPGGEWDQDGLLRIKAVVSRQKSALRLRRDRTRKRFDDFTLHVAFKRMGSRTVVRIVLSPHQASAIRVQQV